MKTKNVAEMFEALASPIRLDVLLALIRAGDAGLVAGEISTHVEVSPTNLSFHLRSLTRSGLVVVDQEGRFLRYRANFGQVAKFVDEVVEDVGAPVAKVLRTSRRRGKK